MKRRKPTSRLVVSLFLGVTIMLAVSWLAAAFADVTVSTFLPNPNAPSVGYLRVVPPRDWTVRTWLARRGLAVHCDLVSESVWMGSALGESPSTAPNRTMDVISVGWPLPALQWTSWHWAFPQTVHKWNSITLDLAWTGGIPMPGRNRSLSTGVQRRFPVRPAPVGFLVNTAFYAAVSWWGVEWWTRMRSRRRLARGACVMCGYDLSGLGKESALCPECGARSSAREGSSAAATMCS